MSTAAAPSPACGFCKLRTASDPRYFATVMAYSDYASDNYSTTWKDRSFWVARCHSCRQRHRQERLLLFISLIAITTAMVLFGAFDSTGDKRPGSGYATGVLINLFFVWSLGCLAFRFIWSRLDRRSTWFIRDCQEVQQALQGGLELGTPLAWNMGRIILFLFRGGDKVKFS